MGVALGAAWELARLSSGLAAAAAQLPAGSPMESRSSLALLELLCEVCAEETVDDELSARLVCTKLTNWPSALNLRRILRLDLLAG